MLTVQGNCRRNLHTAMAVMVRCLLTLSRAQGNDRPAVPAHLEIGTLLQTLPLKDGSAHPVQFIYPLKICCCPLSNPCGAVSFRMVLSPLSTDTWAIPAPISPAPSTARCLQKRQPTWIDILASYCCLLRCRMSLTCRCWHLLEVEIRLKLASCRGVILQEASWYQQHHPAIPLPK